LQNDLGEFWSMVSLLSSSLIVLARAHHAHMYLQVNFINPGILDSYSTFTKIYEKPIVRQTIRAQTLAR
jgi:SNF2 family DNA or RNA helicase